MQNIHINYSINFFSLCEKLKGTYEKDIITLPFLYLKLDIQKPYDNLILLHL